MLSTDQFHLSTGNLAANAGDVSVCSIYLIEPETNETAIFGCPMPDELDGYVRSNDSSDLAENTELHRQKGNAQGYVFVTLIFTKSLDQRTGRNN